MNLKYIRKPAQLLNVSVYYMYILQIFCVWFLSTGIVLWNKIFYQRMVQAEIFNYSGTFVYFALHP